MTKVKIFERKKMISEKPRVRFAPSPTGYLHVGGLRTALYNYLFAKRTGGTFILRIEDTDRKRFVEGAVENLIESLKWCGLNFDEGPGSVTECGPYLQSERLDIYKKYVLQLVESKNAYYCFCNAERLEKLREEQKGRNEQSKYDKHCMHLSEDEVKTHLDNNSPFVIRLNVPEAQTVKFNDMIRGDIEFNTAMIDDQVLLKSDGFPTYHLANVVDDHLMKITHAIRGEEWLSSTPKHVLLYQYFNWEVPLFAHLPLLLNPDKSKLSKRQGDVAVEDYKGKGYLKEALVNFVALLGWTAGDDREFYYLDELVQAFELERVNKSGAVFDIKKLDWLNAEHLRKKSTTELAGMLAESLSESKYAEKSFSTEYLSLVVDAMRERVSFIKEIIENGSYFFEEPTVYDEATVKKRWTAESAGLLNEYVSELKNSECNTKDDFDKLLHSLAEKLEIKIAQIIHPLRIAVSGVGGGPGVFDILYIIGKERVIERINRCVETLSK